MVSLNNFCVMSANYKIRTKIRTFSIVSDKILYFSENINLKSTFLKFPRGGPGPPLNCLGGGPGLTGPPLGPPMHIYTYISSSDLTSTF